VLPPDVLLKTDPDVTVTHVITPRLEEVAAPVAAVEGAEVAPGAEGAAPAGDAAKAPKADS
jgi:hypothetical protein